MCVDKAGELAFRSSPRSSGLIASICSLDHLPRVFQPGYVGSKWFDLVQSYSIDSVVFIYYGLVTGSYYLLLPSNTVGHLHGKVNHI